VEKRQSAVHLAESLFFDFAPYMEQEPDRLLRDEGVSGLNAISVLEAVGRGAERPSQIASRLATAQTNLSRLLQQLLDAALLQRELPFGESTRSTRKVLYRIQDPAVRFWFRVYSPHRSRWPTYAPAQKRKLVHDHAATVFEDYCRAEHPGASRYWDANREFDLVAIDPQDSSRLLVAEVKFRIVSAAERQRLTESLRTRWHGGALRTKYPKVRFAVLDATILG
jgi:AAA+ ATPase superfamily predicted ATPase